MKSDFDEFGVREGVFARERIIVCFPGTQDVFGLVVVEGEAGVGDDDLGFAGDGGHEEGFVVFGVLLRYPSVHHSFIHSFILLQVNQKNPTE